MAFLEEGFVNGTYTPFSNCEKAQEDRPSDVTLSEGRQ